MPLVQTYPRPVQCGVWCSLLVCVSVCGAGVACCGVWLQCVRCRYKLVLCAAVCDAIAVEFAWCHCCGGSNPMAEELLLSPAQSGLYWGRRVPVSNRQLVVDWIQCITRNFTHIDKR